MGAGGFLGRGIVILLPVCFVPLQFWLICNHLGINQNCKITKLTGYEMTITQGATRPFYFQVCVLEQQTTYGINKRLVHLNIIHVQH